MDEFLKILEEMPVGTSSRIKIGENDYACKQLKCTMQSIKEHNIEARGFDEGFKRAVDVYKKWRNSVYLKLKKLE